MDVPVHAHKSPWHLRNLIRYDRHQLMRPERIEQARRDPEFWHPLFRDTATLPPSKFMHAYTLTYGTAEAYIPGVSEDPLVSHAPLRSQPLLELSLRIPMYVLISGGQNRTIARRAFAADLPQEIILRNTKGMGNNVLKTIFFSNIALVRELLLDGFLVREGFIDKCKLEAVLSGRLDRTQSHIMELGAYLDVEAWVRSWDGASRKIAA